MPYQGSGGGGSKPKPKPTLILPWLVPQPKPKPESHSNPNVAVPGDFLSPAPATPQTPSTANPPAERPSYGPENPAPPNYGGPGPVYPGISSAPKPTSSSSGNGKKPDREKERSDKPHIAVPADFVQPTVAPDISAFDLEFGWSSEGGFGAQEALPAVADAPGRGIDPADLKFYFAAREHALVRSVEAALTNEGLPARYDTEPAKFVRENFAEYGLDDEADALAEEYARKYMEEMKPHYVAAQLARDAAQSERNTWIERADSSLVVFVKQHLAMDRREQLVILDANNTGDVLFHQIGVVGEDGREAVGLQDTEAEALWEFEKIFIHNHPLGTGASEEDKKSAFEAGAKLLIIVTPRGYEEVYVRGAHGMELVRKGPASYELAPTSFLETMYLNAWSRRQARVEAVDPAEYVFPEDEPPSPKDYVFHENTRHISEPDIKRDYARYDRWLSYLTFLNPDAAFSDATIFTAVHKFAESAKDSGFDMAGELLQHNLGSSGEPFWIPVDEMIAELPGFRESIMNYVDVELDNYFFSSNAQESALRGGVVEEVGNHTIYSFSLPWKEVGIGGNAEENIYGFDDDDLPANYGTIYALATGQPPLDHIPQEQYDWFLAVNKIHYYPRIAMVVNNTTGIAEVGLVIEVRDHYAWYVNEETGLLNSTMASMERVGLGRNFPVFGRSSLMIGSYNLNEGTAKNGSAHHELTIDGWDNDE